MKVKAWKEVVIIPTYGSGVPEKNPMFFENRVYQGSSGVVYPFPVIEKIYDEKTDKPWNAVFLENKYLKIMTLPELGGRIQMAFDKIKNRHFVYYNQVIKPALVGLTGPWISGGIEFNWPQHHRPSTYEAVDCALEENADGSVTVWCSEIERMFRTKGMTGFTLYPDKAYLEVKVKLYNRTPYPQTFLWWANPAVHVNNDYQSVFPPDVNAVFDHGKRDVSTFPIATGTYYKVDYSAGVDISRYKNIPVPTSYMAITSKYNFVGGYENDTKGGLLHVANHHVSPGKKQWTWGNGDFGRAWDRNLTDADGPYIELMCGVYTDNQPDFSWIMPYEEKSFNQYFMPYRDLGMVKNATCEAMVNMEAEDGKLILKAYSTGIYPNSTIKLTWKEKVIFECSFDFSPETSFFKSIDFPENELNETYKIEITSETGRLLVDWRPEKEEIRPIPEPAKPAPEPKEISSIEQLFLTGLHLEQYRHATYNPTHYYLEALNREPGDVRNNNAMGMWFLRKARFVKAETYFKAAVKTLTGRNPNPYDGEPLYNLGLCLRFQYRYEEAFDAFYKSAWNANCQDAAFFNLAQLAAIKNDWDEALELTDRSLNRNWLNHKARHLKVIILRTLGKTDEAIRLMDDSLQLDMFNFGVLFEKYLFTEDASVLTSMNELMRDNIHNFIEISLDYALAGRYSDAAKLLQSGMEGQARPYPVSYYLLGWFKYQEQEYKHAKSYFREAENADPAYCFPNRIEEVLALQCAMEINPEGSKAPYYLGNFWYGNRQYEDAVKCWEKSVEFNSTFPTVHRNLALAYYNKHKNPFKALKELETAFYLDTSDSRILMELDQLYKKMGRTPDDRLAFLCQYPEAINYRDDLYLELVTLNNLKGQHQQALDLIIDRKFHPWEGGEGKVTGQYLFAHTELAKKAIAEGEYRKALDHLHLTSSFPHNLGEGKLQGAQENDILYWKGCAYEGLGKMQKAIECWQTASIGLSEPTAAMFYNDQQPDKIFYQGLALRKLNQIDEAGSRFIKLKEYGEKHISDKVKVDYFAVSLPDLLIWEDDIQHRNTLHCWYLTGLGCLGLDMVAEARNFFMKVLNEDVYHAGSRIHLAMCKTTCFPEV